MRNYALLLSLALVGQAFPGTHRIPEDEPIATVRIPDDWKVEAHGECVEGVTAKGAVHVLIMPVEGSKVAESMGEAMRYIRRTGTVVVKADSLKRDTTTVKEKHLQIVSWDATDKAVPFQIRCHILSPSEGNQLLVVFWAPIEAGKKYQSQLDGILESVAAP